MPIDYNPKDASNCWDEADYPATLLSVSDGYSKSSGNPMQTWQVEVFNGEKKQTIKEYVVIPAALFKVKQLAKALGKTADFNAGKFQPEEHIGASFVVGLTIEESDGFDDKNRIANFKPAAPQPARQPVVAGNGKAGGSYPLTTAIREKIASQPAPTNPISNVQEFKEDDIPF